MSTASAQAKDALLNAMALFAVIEQRRASLLASARAWRRAHSDRLKDLGKAWRDRNREHMTVWRRNYYLTHRQRILDANKRSRQRCGYRWKHSPSNRNGVRRYMARTVICFDCGLEVYARDATRYPLGLQRKRQFVRCAECERERRDWEPLRVPRYVDKNPRVRAAWSEKHHVFLYSASLAPEPESEPVYEDDHAPYSWVVSTLSEREQELFKLRSAGRTLRQVANKFGLCHERIRQIERGVRERVGNRHNFFNVFDGTSARVGIKPSEIGRGPVYTVALQAAAVAASSVASQVSPRPAAEYTYELRHPCSILIYGVVDGVAKIGLSGVLMKYRAVVRHGRTMWRPISNWPDFLSRRYVVAAGLALRHWTRPHPRGSLAGIKE